MIIDQRRNQKRNENFFGTNENDNTTQQSLWDSGKAILWGTYSSDCLIKKSKEHREMT